MARNGPLALCFHLLFALFIAAPLLVAVAVSFTDKGFLSMPFDGASLHRPAADRGAPRVKGPTTMDRAR